MNLALSFEKTDDLIFFSEYLQNCLGCRLSKKALPPTLMKVVLETQKIPLFYVLNLVVTRQVAGATRGARVKALAIASPKPWVHIFKV